MSLKSVVISLFTRKATREAKESIRRDSDRINEAQKKCAQASVEQREAANKLKETLWVSETLHESVRSKMPTRKIKKPDELDDDTGTATFA